MDNKLLFAVGAVVIVVFLAFVFALPKGSEETNAAQTSTGAGSGMGTKTSDAGSVTVDLTPVIVNEREVSFTIGVNTHSVDLSGYDLGELATLAYDGKTAEPSSAPSLSGHHNTGTLRFAVDKQPSRFTVTIVNLPAGERVFAWP